MTQLIDNTARSRYEWPVDGRTAFVDYRRRDGVLALTHAEVPPELEGRGVGSAMVHAVLEAARANGEKVQPLCSFVAAYMRRHKEFQDLL